MMDYAGYELGTKYRLIRKLKSGGFGDVYLGVHVQLEKNVAIKVLQSHLKQEEGKKFRQEARILARLDHPHIAPVSDFEVEFNPPFNGLPYIVMKYVERGNLRDIYRAGTKLALDTVVRYVQQIASALQYAHRHKVIHLDVKPANILLGDNDELMLCDFGIAIVIANSQGQVLQNAAGTLSYMAPEQLLAKPCSGATDQYALGIVVYEWLCGEVPFKSTSPHVGTQHIIAPVPSLREKNPAVSPAVEEVILRALQKDPAQRFKNILDFASALERASTLHMEPGFYSGQTEAGPILPEMHQPINLAQQVVTNPPSRKPSHTSQRSIPRRRILELVAGAFILSALVELAPKVAQKILSTHLTPTPSPTALRPTPSPTVPHPTPSPTVSRPVNPDYVFYGHTGAVTSLDWSGDKNNPHIASASKDGTVQIWKPNGDERQLYEIGRPINDIAWGRFGLIAFCTDTQIYVSLWNILSAPYFQTTNTSKIKALAWLHDPFYTQAYTQDVVFVSDDGNIAFDWSDQKGIWHHRQSLKDKLNPGLLTVASSPDGKYIATGSTDEKVQVWEVITGSVVLSYTQHSEAVNSIAWSPDGTRIASGSSDSTVHIWDAVLGNTKVNYQEHRAPVLQVAWSPDDKYIASASTDKTIQLWEATTGKRLATNSDHSDIVNAVAWSPDGIMIASGSNDKTVRVWASGLY